MVIMKMPDFAKFVMTLVSPVTELPMVIVILVTTTDSYTTTIVSLPVHKDGSVINLTEPVNHVTMIAKSVTKFAMLTYPSATFSAKNVTLHST